MACNMEEAYFEKLVMKYQSDERVQMAFMQLQYGSQMRLQQRMQQTEAFSNREVEEVYEASQIEEL